MLLEFFKNKGGMKFSSPFLGHDHVFAKSPRYNSNGLAEGIDSSIETTEERCEWV